MTQRSPRTVARPPSATDPILSIETSCDDTCAAVLTGGGRILSSVVSSQAIHGEYEGVVPELASREHLDLLLPAIRRALGEAGLELESIRGIAVTRGPGLIGCLLIGLTTAKALALARRIPFVGVNHIEGHLRAIRAERDLDAPFVALVASGGHTELMHVEAWGRSTLLGSTRDDAAGEAFDKVAKLLGLGFPGGPVIDRLAAEGNPSAFPFPRAYLGIESGGFDFSFSGLKTAVKYFVEERGIPEAGPARDRFLCDVAASFQDAVVDVLVAKLEAACRTTGTRRMLLAGGVACNSALRRRAQRLAERISGELHHPSPALCSDNAVMIGLAGLPRLLRGDSDPIDLDAIANLDDFPSESSATITGAPETPATHTGAAGTPAAGTPPPEPQATKPQKPASGSRRGT
jgi:N6-L-threonylcarbamoyladenine synthase